MDQYYVWGQWHVVFSDQQEIYAELSTYAEQATDLYYGPQKIWKLSFDLANANNIVVKDVCRKTVKASKHWLLGFLIRHRNLSIAIPEATDLSRTTAFSRHNVSLFFNNCAYGYNRYKCGVNYAYSVDKSGLTRVQKP